MRLAFLLGRFAVRPAPVSRASLRFQSLASSLRPNCRHHVTTIPSRPCRLQWRTPPPPRLRLRLRPRLVLFSASGSASLAAAAFVEISEGDSGDSEMTGERRMLAASREELRRRRSLSEDQERGLGGHLRRLAGWLDLFVLEPILTALRLLHLVALFVPVAVTVPVVWLGARDPERDYERKGTLWWYGYLVKSMELAGPAFIKLGQWAASRSDIFPNSMCDIMSKLHSHAPAHSMRATRRILSEAFPGLDLSDIFEDFDETPLGVGAIAQVYKARLRLGLVPPRSGEAPARALSREAVVRNFETVLKSSPHRDPEAPPSTYVAVKVIHPGAERVVRRDLRIMGFFAAVINVIPTMEWLSLPDEVVQFGEMMRLQLDLRIEAANLVKFRANFHDRTTAWFPYPYTELTSRNVLVEEFARGIPLSDFIESGGGVFQHDIAGEGLDAFLRMLILDNFVHADLHPGNIMVRFYQSRQYGLLPSRSRSHPPAGSVYRADQDVSDVTEQALSRLRPLKNRRDPTEWLAELRRLDAEGYRPQLIFIDTGLVTELSVTNRTNFLDLFRAIAEFDGYRAGTLMCERCRQPEAVLDKELFALKLQHLVLSMKSRTLALGNVKIGDLLQEVLGMVRAHHVRLEGDFVNVVISILLLEGIGRSLNPAVDLLSSSLPILRQLGARDGAQLAKKGDFGLLMVWVGLETRRFLQASIEDVERCVKSDLLSPNV